MRIFVREATHTMSETQTVIDAPANGPVIEGDRIASLDVLRGFAVLGILVMNIQSFSMIGAAYLNPYAFYMESSRLLMATIWRAGGLMLIGMALFKLGILNAARSTGTYIAMIATGAFVGLPVVAFGVFFRNASDWDVRSAFFGGAHSPLTRCPYPASRWEG